MRRVLTVLCLVTVLLATLLGVAYAAPLQQGGEEYTVQADDWLSKLAEKNYGDVLAWPVIWKGTLAISM